VAVEEGIEFDHVGIAILRIDVPDQWLGRPLGSHERVFAPHEVQVARPEDLVVAILGQEGECELAQRPSVKGARRRAREQERDRARRPDQGRQQIRQRGVRVGEHGYRQLVGLSRRQAEFGAKCRLVKGGAAGVVVGLTQQTASGRIEARKEEMLHQGQAWMWRGLAMAGGDPGFGREVFEVEPYRLGLAARHCRDVLGWWLAGEGFNHDIGRVDGLPGLTPWADVHRAAGMVRRQPVQGLRIVDPESDPPTMIHGELPGQAPTDPRIAIVVDHGAENVAENVVVAGRRCHGEAVS
jgi:hypothetical protein